MTSRSADPHVLDLVALGTVCDVVPLQGLNRALCAAGHGGDGAGTNNIGIQALGRVCARKRRSMGHLSAWLPAGPARQCRRPRRPVLDLGVRLLSTGESSARGQWVWRNGLMISTRSANPLKPPCKMRPCVILRTKLLQTQNALPPYILQAGDGWHAGCYRHCCGAAERINITGQALLSPLMKTGFGKGSARSVSSVDIGRLVAGAVDREAD